MNNLEAFVIDRRREGAGISTHIEKIIRNDMLFVENDAIPGVSHHSDPKMGLDIASVSSSGAFMSLPRDRIK